MILIIYGILENKKNKLMENRLETARGSGQYFSAISKTVE